MRFPLDYALVLHCTPMPMAPIAVRSLSYTGRNPRRLAKMREQIHAAEKLKAYINERVGSDGAELFIYGFLAVELYIPLAMVRNLLGAAGGGYNGIRVWGKDYKAPQSADE